MHTLLSVGSVAALLTARRRARHVGVARLVVGAGTGLALLGYAVVAPGGTIRHG